LSISLCFVAARNKSLSVLQQQRIGVDHSSLASISSHLFSRNAIPA